MTTNFARADMVTADQDARDKWQKAVDAKLAAIFGAAALVSLVTGVILYFLNRGLG